ncbi:hypothetical protein EDD85DRAFT_961642 [Armillaria nabsnona]|nr:hypothetical protein EDD85DRAFT_961642 [Armillaria nabsnona]
MSSVPAGQSTKLPALDNSLGALYIGSSLPTVLYGVICVQTFLHVTSNRTRYDSWAMKLLVFILFVSNSIPISGLSAPDHMSRLATYDDAIVAICSILLVQLFFCWRVWTFSASSLHLYIRIAIIAISVALAFLNFASYICLSIFGFRHHFFAVNSSDFTVSWKLSASSGIAFDVIMTIAMSGRSFPP